LVAAYFAVSTTLTRTTVTLISPRYVKLFLERLGDVAANLAALVVRVAAAGDPQLMTGLNSEGLSTPGKPQR
jgi:hypothetical protein